MLGLTPQAGRERFDHIVAFAELEGFMDLRLKNYSSGMLVRLAFATAIQVDAEILLIDEVLAVGDAPSSRSASRSSSASSAKAARSCSSPTTCTPSSASATARC
jgi:ABC-type polysaccharide/polyol phosphate transport system ATPase subunit